MLVMFCYELAEAKARNVAVKLGTNCQVEYFLRIEITIDPNM